MQYGDGNALTDNEKDETEKVYVNQNVVISTKSLFGKSNEILIDHDNTLYRLKITRQGKLILNK
ncbi:MAG: hemin uptake protein HemP [Methyloligellaceae bacterium]